MSMFEFKLKNGNQRAEENLVLGGTNTPKIEKLSSGHEFLTLLGHKITDGEHYNLKDDTTDQRSPVNNPEMLYEQFVVPEDIMEELDSENVDDFDDDIYPYEDRSEMGEDIALAARLDFKRSSERIKAALQGSSNKNSVKENKDKKERHEDIDNVDPGEDE